MMSHNLPPHVRQMIDDPLIERVLCNVNLEMQARNKAQPSTCAVFADGRTQLVADGSYRFNIDPEAARNLPDLINKQVQTVCRLDDGDTSGNARMAKRRRIGIVFSGGPAPGGHNVIAGLFDAAKQANPDNEIFGFILGPDGIIENEAMPLTKEIVDAHRNLGGFSMIKTGRTKIDTADKMALSRKTCKALGLDALVVVGGDDSNTNAAFLAQALLPDGVQVIGVPKTIDGDVQVKDADGRVLCAMSFGFHTAARAFANAIANLCTDCNSDMKYWHICKVMGRSASHLALEVALQTHANLTLIGEDVAAYVDTQRIEAAKAENSVDYGAYGMSLRHVSRIICDAIVRRAAVGKNCGVVVIPEGLLEFINEIQVIIIKLNTIIGEYNRTHDNDFHSDFPLLENKLEYLRRLVRGIRKGVPANVWNARDDELFNDMPDFFQEGLLTERDSHGNFQFSQVPTEKVIMEMVKDYLNILKEKGRYWIGINRDYFCKTLKNAGLAPDDFGPVLFQSYAAPYLLFKEHLISLKMIKKELVDGNLLATEADDAPRAIIQIYNKAMPKFKTQNHFYGYDGRGSDPTRFDCDYTYNLGLTVFSLIAGGATGQMAAIKYLEKPFDQWMPIGIPIAPLMGLEERKGKLALVLEKSLVDIESSAFKVAKACREQWLGATPGPENYRKPGPIHYAGATEEGRPITLSLNSHDYRK